MNTPSHIILPINLKLFLYFSVLGIAVGCATTNPKQDASITTASTMAKINCKQDNKRDIVIRAIDGRTTVAWFQGKKGVKEAEVEEGTHDVDLICTVGETVYEGRLEITTIPKHIYQVHVQILGYGAKFAAEDITTHSGMSPTEGKKEE